MFFNFSSGHDKLRAAHITYKQKNVKKLSRDLNLGKGPVHLRFDGDGQIFEPKSCKSLGKVKRFLAKSSDEQEEAGNMPESHEYAVDIKDVMVDSDTDEGDTSGDENVAQENGANKSTTCIGIDNSGERPKGSARKKKKNKRKVISMPPEVQQDEDLRKYWHQRYRLFSKFDEGVKLDKGR